MKGILCLLYFSSNFSISLKSFYVKTIEEHNLLSALYIVGYMYSLLSVILKNIVYMYSLFYINWISKNENGQKVCSVSLVKKQDEYKALPFVLPQCMWVDKIFA